ncbi:hypothetical protein IJ531_06280 [bacterium]|nr:hypothetical protein [bacterium]
MDKQNYSFKRWYDVKPYTDEVLSILKELSLQSHYDIAREVLKIIEAIKVNSRDIEDAPLSIGVERALGLYSQNYKRRWYDKNLPIARIFKSASCLQDDDFQNIMQGMYTSLKDDK